MIPYNKYDEEEFFQKYSKMERSLKGLDGAGEWQELKKMLPEFTGKRVLDLGCGYGWHCRYAIEQGAGSAIGIDISMKMLEEARRKTRSDSIKYLCLPIEEMDFPDACFEIVISSLAFHYIENLEEVINKVYRVLTPGGNFVFSAEHPIFTAQGTQDWHYDQDGEKLHWPVDRYFEEGIRRSVFLEEEVMKYHRTLTTYVNNLIKAGFEITGLVEPQPPEHMLRAIPGMQEELRRPMMILISARKR